MATSTDKQEDLLEALDSDTVYDHFLILHNDNYNTFDFVIDSLIEVCKHDFTQAKQCALLTHYKGKCDVKKGSFEYLEPMKTALQDRGLSVSID